MCTLRRVQDLDGTAIHSSLMIRGPIARKDDWDVSFGRLHLEGQIRRPNVQYTTAVLSLGSSSPHVYHSEGEPLRSGRERGRRYSWCHLFSWCAEIHFNCAYNNAYENSPSTDLCTDCRLCYDPPT